MKRVIQNGLDNAKRYMDKQEGQVKIILRETPASYIIEIWDNGPGIAEEHLPHIFDRFYRADSARKSDDGSGLGLAIAKQIVEDHQGHIWVRSKVGEGTSLLIALNKREHLPLPHGGVGPMKKILIVEDDQSIANLQKDYLELNGYEVKITDSGQHCLRLLEEEHFDLVILDIMLPGLDGFKVLEKIRERMKFPSSLFPPGGKNCTRLKGWAWGQMITLPNRSAPANWWPGWGPT